MNYKNIYKEAVNEIDPSPEFINKVRSGKEHRIMKFNRKRIAIAAVAACIAVTTTAFAAGHITTLIGWSSPFSENTNYSSVSEYIKKADLKADIPEELTNGYKFNSSNTGGIKGIDEDGHTIARGKKFEVTYKKADHPDITLDVDPIFKAEDHSFSTAVREINGVTVYYNKDKYKVVPPDYELTEEDNMDLEDPHYYISYGDGTEDAEFMNLDSIVFEIDGKIYTLLSMDNDMSADEWFDLAEDFIK